MQTVYPKKLGSYTRAFGQDYSRPCFTEVVVNFEDERHFLSKHADKDIKILPLPEVTAGAVMVLKILGRHSAPIHKNLLIRHFFGAYDNKMDPHMDVLRERKYIMCKEDQINITELGKDFLRQYNIYGLEDVQRRGYKYAIINFLRRSNGPVREADFPKFLIDSCPTDRSSFSREDDLAHYLEFTSEMRPFVEEKQGFFTINPAGINFLEIENREQNIPQPIYELNMLDSALGLAARRDALTRNGYLPIASNEKSPQIESQNPKEVLREVEVRSALVEHHYHAPVTQTSISGNIGPVVQDSTIHGSQLSGTSLASIAAPSKPAKTNKTKKIRRILAGIPVVSGAIYGVIKLIAHILHLLYHP